MKAAIRAFVFAFVALLAFSPAAALTSGQKPVILSGVQSWSFPGSSADLYFSRNAGSCAINRIAKPCSSLLSVTRAQTVSSYAQWADGHLSAFAANTPRITDQGLLVEQSSVNLVLQSNTPATTWTQQNVVAANGAATGPDGVAASAGSITDNSTNAVHSIFETAVFTAASGTTYTFSGYFQAGTATVVQLTYSSTNFTGVGYANFNLSNGTVSATGGTLASSGILSAGNGWYRCWISAVATGNGGATPNIQMTNSNASASRSPAYVGSGQTLNVWGVQVEALAFTTSPIPTTTTSVTRNADVISLTGAAATAALNAKAARFESNLVAGGNTPRLANFGSATVAMNYASSTTINIVDGSGDNATATLGAGSYSTPVKSAFGMDNTSITSIANGGTQAVNSTSSWATNAATPIYLGNRSAGDRALNGFIRRATFGPVKGQFDATTN